MKLVTLLVGLALVAGSTIAVAKVAKVAKAPVEKQGDLWSLVQKANPADLKYAALSAKRANTPRSNIRLACYLAWGKALEHKDKFGLLNLDGSPSSAVMPANASIANYEERQQAADHLDPVGFLMAACQPAASLAKLPVEKFFSNFVANK